MAGIVVHGDRVLVIRRRDNGHWEPPGGVLEPGETLEQGLRREVLEETGVAVRVRQLTGVYQHLVRNVVALVFRCEASETGVLRPTGEAAEVCWLPVAEAQALMTPVFAVRLADAFGDEVRTRVHDGVRLLGQQFTG